MIADDVAAWLRANPDFFIEHSEVFAALKVPHPEGGHAISMVERQLISLRERAAQLEGRIEQLIGFGQKSDVLADKMHRLTLALLRAPDRATTIAVVNESIRSDFEIPYSVVRWWGDDLAVNNDGFPAASADFRAYVSNLDRPYVGPVAAYESRDWIDNDAGRMCQSFAYLPLSTHAVQGALFLASPDAARFTPDMAVDVLFRLANIVSVALARNEP